MLGQAHPNQNRFSLFEASGWLILLSLTQVASGIAVAALLVTLEVGVPGNIYEMDLAFQLLTTDPVPAILVGSAAVLPVLVIVPLVMMRVGSDWRPKLRLNAPHPSMLLLALGGMIPIAIVSAALHNGAMKLGELAGFTSLLPDLTSAGLTADRLGDLPFLTLISVMCLAPALTEEFLFRGLIGNGLTKRFGTGMGIVITTTLFAGAHMSPAYAIAVVPLGLFLHVVYITTDSLKAAVGLHFANNLFAVVAIRFHLLDDLAITMPLVWISLGTVLAISSVLWQRRFGVDANNQSIFDKLPSQALAGTAVGGFTVLFVAAMQ